MNARMPEQSIRDLISALRSFDRRREVINQVRRELRAAVPPVRKAIRARALATLPRSGGLGAWVAKASVTAQFQTSGRTVGLYLRGSRKSGKGKADLRSIDRRGRVRHPSWGRRGPGQWHTQTVRAGYFSDPSTEAGQWFGVADRAVDRALGVIWDGP